jgi:hypothetical protein
MIVAGLIAAFVWMMVVGAAIAVFLILLELIGTIVG